MPTRTRCAAGTWKKRSRELRPDDARAGPAAFGQHPPGRAVRAVGSASAPDRGHSRRRGEAARQPLSAHRLARRHQGRGGRAPGFVYPGAARTGGFRARAHRAAGARHGGARESRRRPGLGGGSHGLAVRRVEGAHDARGDPGAGAQSDGVSEQCPRPRPDVRHRSRRHGKDLSGGGLRRRGAAGGERAPDHPGAPGRGGGRAAGVPAGGSCRKRSIRTCGRCTMPCTK